MRIFSRRAVLTFILITFLYVGLVPQRANAIPAFARKYPTSCTTCHSDFPKLNDFGKAFKDAGFKFPKEDETFIKVPPVLLGADAQKQLWPNTVWPGQIDGMPPIGLRMNTFLQFNGRSAANFNALAAPNTIPPFIPRTDFQTGLFSIFTAGNFGSDIAYWVDDDISVGGDNGNGGLGDGYLKFVNVGRFFKLPKDSLSLRVGQFELDLPFTQARNINLSPYDVYTQSNIGAMNGEFTQQNVNNQFSMANAGQGVEISGGHTYGGYHYSLAFINQNTSGSAPNASPFVPAANGVGFASDSNFKDLYGRVSYRFNLERDKESRNAIQAAGTTGPREHTYLNLGTYYFYGRSVNPLLVADASGNPAILIAREPFYRAGGDFSFNYRNFNIYGLFMHGHDHDLFPIDANGSPVPLPIAPPPELQPVGFARTTPATFTGGFVQADYLAKPWMMVILRWDGVNSTADRINGLAGSTSTPFALPFRSTRNRVTPGVQFLIHANIKASFEYQFRPQQSAQVSPNDAGIPTAQFPFRTNTAVVALEWVY